MTGLFTVTHPEHLFHLGDAFDKYGPELVADAGQEESEQRDAEYCI